MDWLINAPFLTNERAGVFYFNSLIRQGGKGDRSIFLVSHGPAWDYVLLWTADDCEGT
jgi:hypothetical protein